MKKLLSLTIGLLLCLSASAANKITVTVAVTNAPVAGDTFTLNGEVRTFRATVADTRSQIQWVTSNSETNATNFYNAITSFTYPGPPTLAWLNTTNFTITGVQGMAMVASSSGTWAAITYATNLATWTSSSYTPLEDTSPADIQRMTARNTYQLTQGTPTTIAGQTSAINVSQTNLTSIIETQGSFTTICSGDTNVVIQLTNAVTLVRTLTLTAYSNFVANSGDMWIATSTNGPFMLLNSSTGPWSKTATPGMVFPLSTIYLRSTVTNGAVNAFYAQ